MNETLQILRDRRSVRAFSDIDLTDEQVSLIKEATLRAPTAGNMALYSVIEIHDQKKKEQLARLCDNQIMITKAPLVWVFLADMQKWVNFFTDGGSREKGEKEGLASWRDPGLGDLHLCMQDAIIAAQNAVVAAESLGIGSCYIGDVIENFEALRDLLELDHYTVPACMVIFGNPKSEPTGKQTPRCPQEAIFMQDRYDSPTLEQLQYAFSEHEKMRRELKILPFRNTGSIADHYYFKKHTSSFMQEMNRSTKVMFDHWCTS
ncbi:MAG TPA: nitroreductase [Sphaerochaeta sp.]|jgi:nitroreductase|nr:nitroreductase [Sphaerochaeta sp.]